MVFHGSVEGMAGGLVGPAAEAKGYPDRRVRPPDLTGPVELSEERLQRHPLHQLVHDRNVVRFVLPPPPADATATRPAAGTE
jgi:hypothetical protein